MLAGTKYDNWVKGSTAPSIIYTNNATVGAAHNEIEKKSEAAEWTENGSSYDPANILAADKIPLTRHVARVQLQAIDCVTPGAGCTCEKFSLSIRRMVSYSSTVKTTSFPAPPACVGVNLLYFGMEHTLRHFLGRGMKFSSFSYAFSFV